MTAVKICRILHGRVTVMYFADSHKATTSQVRVRSEWPISGESNHWIASIVCPIGLAENYTPEDNQKGFSIYLVLEEHATNINSVCFSFITLSHHGIMSE